VLADLGYPPRSAIDQVMIAGHCRGVHRPALPEDMPVLRQLRVVLHG